MHGGDAHAHEIDPSPGIGPDSGFLEAPESASGNRSIASDPSEHGPPIHGVGMHDFEPSSLAQGVSGATLGAPGHSFHFKEQISGPQGSGIIDAAKLNDSPALMRHHEDAAGTHGPPVISEGGETPGALGDSFHFIDEPSGFKGSGILDVAGLDQIPASTGHHEDAAHGPPAISGEAQTIELLGQQPADLFNIASDYTRSALVTHVPHDLIV